MAGKSVASRGKTCIAPSETSKGLAIATLTFTGATLSFAMTTLHRIRATRIM
jgi:hypothetical protein